MFAYLVDGSNFEDYEEIALICDKSYFIMSSLCRMNILYSDYVIIYYMRLFGKY